MKPNPKYDHLQPWARWCVEYKLFWFLKGTLLVAIPLMVLPYFMDALVEFWTDFKASWRDLERME